MTETGTTRRAQLPPPVEDIRAELIRIRGTREGLGAEAVIDHGKKLQLLPTVTHEVVRRNRPPGSRPDATVKVVRCAVNHLVKEPWKTFLRFTLTDPGGRKVEERKQVAADTVGVSSISARDDMDAKSYRDLARALVEAVASPCFADEAQRLAGLQLKMAEVFSEMVDLLSDMGVNVTADAQQRAIRLLGARLPEGARLLAGGHNVESKIRQLIAAALSSHGPVLAARVDYLSADLLRYRLTGAVPLVAGMDHGELDDEELELLQVEAGELLQQSAEQLPDYTERLENSLIFVADALLYEELNGWPSLREPRSADLPWSP